MATYPWDQAAVVRLGAVRRAKVDKVLTTLQQPTDPTGQLQRKLFLAVVEGLPGNCGRRQITGTNRLRLRQADSLNKIKTRWQAR